MRVLLVVFLLLLAGCHGLPRPSLGELRAYCATLAYQLTQGEPIGSVVYRAGQAGVWIQIRSDTLRCGMP